MMRQNGTLSSNWLYPKNCMLKWSRIPYTAHRGQNSEQINIAKYISKFLVCGAKMLDKCVKGQKKRFLYIVLFCKVKLCKMASIKTNKIKKQTALFAIFHDVQLCFWSGRDSSPLKVFKMYFVYVLVCNQNIPDMIWNVLIWHSKKTMYILKTFRGEESLLDQKQSCISWKIGLKKCCLFSDFVCFNGRHFT